MNRVPIFEEYRLIERSENEINGAWKGAHLLLFFLAFVFGSFCTFCFHMLMYLFDEKCVLFPKLLSLTSLKHNVIYEFIPSSKDLGDLPVDFVSTQWVEKSTCSLPTYVPLVSGIFGLVWTTMFLMCSTGSRTLTGLQRPWRVLPPVFVFSLAMGGLCVYSSAVTHYGLQELCLKLGEITGSPTCTYTVNVATLTYERRIRGVYQATRLTILSAWLHTACWILSALLALVRVLMAIDFQLVRVSVHLHGDIDKILEKHEVQIRTVSPETWLNDELECESDTKLPPNQPNIVRTDEGDILTELPKLKSDLIFLALAEMHTSELSLVPDERYRLDKLEAYKNVPKDKAFIVTWLYDLVQTLRLPEVSDVELEEHSSSFSSLESGSASLIRQFGQSKIASQSRDLDLSLASEKVESVIDEPEVKEALKRIDSLILNEYHRAKKTREPLQFREGSPEASTSKPAADDSVMNITPDMQRVLDTVASSREQNATLPEEDATGRKSNLKNIGVQTEKHKKDKRSLRVQISEKSFIRIKSDTSHANEETSASSKKKEVDKETQTREKEKQD